MVSLLAQLPEFLLVLLAQMIVARQPGNGVLQTLELRLLLGILRLQLISSHNQLQLLSYPLQFVFEA